MSDKDVKLGYIGLGDMGTPMAKRLVGWPGGLTVFDIRLDAMTPLAEAGAQLADSVADVAKADSLPPVGSASGAGGGEDVPQAVAVTASARMAIRQARCAFLSSGCILPLRALVVPLEESAVARLKVGAVKPSVRRRSGYSWTTFTSWPIAAA